MEEVILSPTALNLLQIAPIVLAVGHEDGTVTLREVENAKILHKFTIGIEIMYLSWTICPS